MFSRRYTIAIADLKSGVERRCAVSLTAVLAVLGAVVILLIAFGAIWKLTHDVQGLSASHRALEIETSNYRAAIEVLIRHIESQQSTGPQIVAEPGGPSESSRLESAARTAVMRRNRATAAAPTPPPVSELFPLPAAISPVSPAAAGEEHGPAIEAASRGAFMEALAEAASERLRLADEEPPVRPVLGEAGGATLQAVEETILEVVSQYVRGLESRSLPTLKRVWPSLGGSQERAIQAEFENARTVHTLFNDPRITVDGDTTTVTGVRIYSLVTQDGQRLSSMTRTTMTLRRIGNAWVIDRIVHQQ